MRIYEKNGKNYKVEEVREGHLYTLKKQRKNGVYYKISSFNATSLDESVKYCKEYKD